MKGLLFFLMWALLPAMGTAQEVDLLPSRTVSGKNLRVGVAAHGATLNGIVSRDEQNNFAYLPVSGDLSLQNFPATLQEVLYALAPPDADNTVIAWVIISNPVAPDGFDLHAAMNDAIPDALNQNGWTAASHSVQSVSAGVQLPAGTQFWTYSSTGKITLAGGPAIFLTDATSVDQVIATATRPVTLDPRQFMLPDPDPQTADAQVPAGTGTHPDTDPGSGNGSGDQSSSVVGTTE